MDSECMDANMQMAFKEGIKARGDLSIDVCKGGKLIEEIRDTNLIVDIGKETLAHLLGSGSGGNFQPVSQIKFGAGSTAAVAGDSDLESVILAKPLSGVSFPAVNEVKFAWTVLESEANGTAIREFGLFGFDSPTYFLFSRVVRPSVINKEADILLTGTWTIRIL